MLKGSFPNGPPRVGQFELIAEMELPEFVLTGRAIDKVPGIHRQVALQSVALGGGEGTGYLGKIK